MVHIVNGRNRLTADPRAILALSLWAGLCVLVAVLWSRWLTGALTVPLSAPYAWTSCGVIAAIAVAALVIFRQSALRHHPQTNWLPVAITLLLPVLWGGVLAGSASPFTGGGLTAVWGITLVSVGCVHRWVPATGISAATSSEPAGDVALQNFADGPQATHWQKRITLPEGDLIEGGVQVNFTAGQKEALVHLAFCPPLSAVPEIHAEDANGGDLEVRTAVVHTFGARISVRRRSGIDSAETRELSYTAIPPGSQDAAA